MKAKISGKGGFREGAPPATRPAGAAHAARSASGALVEHSSKPLPPPLHHCIQGVSLKQVGNYGDAGFHQSI